MSPGDALLVAAAGLAAGAVNAVAGGGTLITFPALLSTGMGAVAANITSSVGLITGYAGGSVAYRRELAGQGRRVRALGLAAVLGGVLGAVVLLLTPSSSFRTVVPFLILFSCLLLAGQPWLSAALARSGRRRRHGGEGSDVTGAVRGGVFVAAVYGSYFGAGLGVLLLGVLGVLVDDVLQRLNALKGLLSLTINAVGVVVFLGSGRVEWAYAGILALTAWLGATFGVALARRLPSDVLRYAVIAFGVAVASILIATD